MYFIEYDTKTGQIQGGKGGEKPPEFAKGSSRACLTFKEDHIDHQGKRVNLTTKKLEDCPKLARRGRIGQLRAALAEIDVRRQRALEDFYLDGNKSPLQKVRADAEPLRAELSKLLSEDKE